MSGLTPSFIVPANVTFPAAAIYEASEDSVVPAHVTVVLGVLATTRVGSGFVHDAGDRIITYDHVVEGTYSIEVAFLDGSEVEATQLSSDPFSDLVG